MEHLDQMNIADSKVTSRTNGGGRNSKFEILRIISIVLVIFAHYCGHGFTSEAPIPLINEIILNLGSIGGIGVPIFMMISGYFLANSRKIKWIKVAQYFLEGTFYMVLLYGLSFVLFEPTPTFSIADLYKTLFGVFGTTSYFLACYVLVYLFHPFINKIFESSNLKQQTLFIAILLVCWSIIPTFLFRGFQSSDLTLIFLSYCIGVYLNKNQDHKWVSKKTGGLLLIINLALVIASILLLMLLSNYFEIFSGHITHFAARNSIFMVLAAMGSLILCIKSKPYQKKFINYVASFTLGIYLIHDNNTIRNYLWTNLIHVNFHAETYYLIPHMLCSIIVIFIGCIFIDMVRRYCLEKPFFLLLDKIIKKIQSKRKPKEIERNS